MTGMLQMILVLSGYLAIDAWGNLMHQLLAASTNTR